MPRPRSNGKTMEALRKRGLHVEYVEKFIPRTNQRKDLFGLWDCLAIDMDTFELLAVQSCGTDVQPHIRKLTGQEDGGEALLERHRAWILCGGRSELWSWRRLKWRLKDKTWSKTRRWHLRRWIFELSPGGVTAHSLQDET